jgi:hypothetical protein
MSHAQAAAQFPSLFSHRRRANWGVGVMSGESDGKRSYLFEDGEERVMGAGGIELMDKIEHPDSEQQATCVHLMSLLAKRKRGGEPTEAPGTSAVIRQLDRFHKKYHGGFFGKSWREDDKSMKVRQTRGVLAPKVRAELATEKLQELQATSEAIWPLAQALLAESGLGTGKAKKPIADVKPLAEALVDLLHGADPYEQRFDRFVAAYELTYGEAPTWQTATALPALMFPDAHVYVDPTPFRKQLKALARYSAFAARPSGGAYARCLGMAQVLANMLAARGEVPRDLLDVHDFVRVTV